MDTIPVASFLAGALLSLLLPTLLLIAIVVWSHVEVIRRAPEPPRRPRSPGSGQDQSASASPSSENPSSGA